MNDTNKVALATAIAAGYALGRTRKAKLALTVGTYLAGRRFKLSPQELVTEGVSRLRETPQFNAISDQVRGDLLTAGRSALTAAADRRFDSLADTLRERTSLLSSPRSEEDEEDDDSEYEEWEDEPEDEYAEEEDDDFGEAYEDEEEPEPEPAPRRRSPAAKKSPPAKKSVPSKKSPPAKKSAARKPGEDRPAKKAAKKPSPEKLSGKKAPGRKATDERPAKKTAKKAPAKESAAKKPPAKSARRSGREG